MSPNMSSKESNERARCISLLSEWCEFCDENSALHDLNRAWMKSMNNWFSIPAILLSTIGGAANIGFSNKSDDENRKQWVPIFFGCMSLTAAALFTIHRNLSIAELQQQHDFYSDEFAKLANEIKMQLYIDSSDSKTYKNIVEFCKDCKHHLDVLIDKAPPISMSIRNKLKKISEKQGGNGSYQATKSIVLFGNTVFTNPIVRPTTTPTVTLNVEQAVSCDQSLPVSSNI